jgi:hypothetical protein
MLRGVATLACVLVIGALGASAAASETDHPEEVRKVFWAVAKVKAPRTFEARSVGVGTCGPELPWLEPRVREHGDGSVAITMFLHLPAVHLERTQACALRLYRPVVDVTLKRRLHDVTLYDAGKSPPQRRALPWERKTQLP